jgi:Reverse transcriptase (RNA-dependent DNA polymerase)
MCARNSISIGNSWFEKRKSQKITRYGYGDEASETIIDYICVGTGMAKNLMDVTVIPSVALDGDHRLVVGKIRGLHVKGARNRKRCRNTKIKVWKLQDKTVKREFENRIAAQMPSGELLSVEEEWKAFKEVFVKSAEETCGRVGGKRKEKETAWWNDRVKEAVKNKNEAWRKNEETHSEKTDTEYRQRKREAREIVKEEKQKSMEKFAAKLEEDFQGNKKMLYSLVKSKRRHQDEQKFMLNNQGVLTNNSEEILEVWRKHFSDLLNVPTDPVKVVQQEREETEDELEEESELSEAEVWRALKDMKNGRAPGIDEVTVEMIKSAGECGKKWLFRVMKAAWKQKRIPKEWGQGIIVPLFKKGDKKCAGNYRGVTLMCQCAKLFEKVLEFRLKTVVEANLREEQYGFRGGRSTTDAIFAIRQVMERKWEEGKEVHLTFLDLEKAYDRLPRERVWASLKKKGVERGLRDRIMCTYESSESCVQTQLGKSKWFQVKDGLRQGSVLSPCLFVIVMDEILRRVEPNEDGDTRTLIYADDVAVWGDSSAEVQSKIDRWSEITEEFGLKISVEKSESLIMEKKLDKKRGKIRLKDKELEEKVDFKYLGSLLSKDAKVTREVEARVCKADGFYQSVRKLLWNLPDIQHSAYHAHSACIP